MIELTYPSKRVKKASVSFLPKKADEPNAFEQHQANIRKISVAEYRRRDDIIRNLAYQVLYVYGDTVYPYLLKDYEKYGAFMIEGVARSYKDFGPDDKWPSDDRPKILTIKGLRNDKDRFICTVDYVVKNNPHFDITPPSC